MPRLLVLILLSTLASAQDFQPQGGKIPTKTESQNKLPISKEPLRVKLPKVTEIQLDNGLTILLIEDHRLPEISMRLQIRGAGSVFDPPGISGLANVTAAMLSQGTITRTAKQMSEQTDLLSANIDAFVSSLESVFEMSGLAENFDRWFDLGIDELLHPAFPIEEWSKMKQRRLAGMQTQSGNPSALTSERFNQAVFGVHPAASIMTPATLEAITIDAMRKWYGERYAPQNAILGIVGDVTPGTLVPRLKATLSPWKRNDYRVPVVPDPAALTESRVILVNRPGAVQTNLVVGGIVPGRRDADFETLQVLINLLGLNLRRNLSEHGYSYLLSVTSNISAGELAGPWRVQAAFRTEVTDEALGEVFNELRKIRGDDLRDEKQAADSLDFQKIRLAQDFAVSLERPDQVLQYTLDRKTFDLPEDYWDTYISRISAVNAAALRRAARRYLDPNSIQIVAVGDASRIQPVLAKYGKITLYDVNGNRIPR